MRVLPACRSRVVVLTVFFGLTLAGCGGSGTASAAKEDVIINGRILLAEEVQALTALYGVAPVPGDYWYDSASGLFGKRGQASMGFMMPAHSFGQLAADASNGKTGVVLNGRILPQQEVDVFSAIWGAPVQPGRYWLNGEGYVGYEGNPMPLGNLYAQVAARSGGGTGSGGDNIWNTRYSAGNYTNDNSSGYVNVPGVGPVGYGLD